MTAVARYRCHTCAATFTAWSPAEKHADAEHHHRVELVLDADPEPPARRRNPA